MKWVRILVVVALVGSIFGCGGKQKKKVKPKHEDVVQPLNIEPDGGSEE